MNPTEPSPWAIPGLVVRPCRIQLDYDFLATYCEWLWNKRDLTPIDCLEMQAMVQVAVRDTSVWGGELEDLWAKLRTLEDHAATFLTGLHSERFTACMKELFLLVYSPFVEPWEKWEELSKRIDASAPNMAEQEYTMLLDCIKTHGVEITNIRHLVKGEGLEHNPNVKNYAGYDALWNEVTKYCQGVESKAGEAYLRFKVNAAHTSGFLSLRERDFILARMNNLDLVEYTANRMKRYSVQQMDLGHFVPPGL